MPAKGGKKGRKIGRDKAKCQKYRDLGIRELNKERKARKRAKQEEYFAKRRTLREEIKEVA